MGIAPLSTLDPIVARQIENIKIKCERIKPLVVVRTLAYNHEKYLRDTLNGFVNQKTTFPFVVIVHDDASTDKTAQIIREYTEKFPDIILPIYEQENQYSKRNRSLANVVNTASIFTQAQYIALCEGDDYWIDPLKLQKQIDKMESDNTIMLTFHAVYEQSGCEEQNRYVRSIVEDREYSGIEYFTMRPSQTAAYIFRSRVINSELYNNIFTSNKFSVGDIPLVMVCAKLGKLYGISDVMSIYRHHPGGWSTINYSKDKNWEIIKMQLNYQVFGSEYEKPSKYFAQKQSIGVFLSQLKSGKFEFDYLCYSLKLSIRGTFRAFKEIISRKKGRKN